LANDEVLETSYQGRYKQIVESQLYYQQKINFNHLYL